MRATSVLFSLFLAAVTAGCGSSSQKTDGGGGNDAPTVFCPNDPVDPTAMIDDMEATDPAILRIGGRNGSWWAGGDDPSKAAGGSIVPDGPVTAEVIPGGRCESLHAVHVTGQRFSEWAVVTASLGWGSIDGGAENLLPHDAHIRTGVTFWARVGDTSTNQIRFNVGDRYSRPEGGFCVDGPTMTPENACYDYFGVPLTLKTTWQQFRIPFLGLAQQSFGLRRDAVDTTGIYSLDFSFPTGSIFDLWVDDLSFY
jgi:hypothetical protein